MIAWPELRIGVTSPDAGNWQRFLRSKGYRDADNRELVVDEKFGPRTAFATRSWQRLHGHAQSGTVSLVDRGVAAAEGFIPFLLAKNFTSLSNQSSRSIDVITIHDMEYPELPTSAEWCAQFFAGSAAPRASAHYSVDSNSIVQSVRDRDVAWHAPGANHNGIGIEHAGYAKQSRAQWLDAYSRQELAISAKLVAHLCALYEIPIVKLGPAELRTGEHGICGHVDVSVAFGKSTHYDPGPNFPWDEYLALVELSARDGDHL